MRFIIAASACPPTVETLCLALAWTGGRITEVLNISRADLDAETILDAHSRRTSSVEEKFELIAAGHGIAMVPVSVARSYSRPDLVYLRVTDAEPVETCIAVADGRRERRVRDFVSFAARTLGEPQVQLAAVD